MCTFVPETFIGINFHEIVLACKKKAKISIRVSNPLYGIMDTLLPLISFKVS